MGWYIITFLTFIIRVGFSLSKKPGSSMEGPESFLTVRQKYCYFYINTAVLMYPARSGFSHSLTLSLLSLSLTHISHQHEQKEEAFARGEIVGGEDP